jgi:acyl-CoA thioester hydrolase
MPRDPATRSAYPFFRTFSTRWRDNDLYGHLNNAVYYEYVDTLVNGWLIDRGGLPVPGGDVVCIVAESGCTYRASLGFPGAIDAGLRADRVWRSSITYGIGLFAAGTQAAAAEARFTHVCVDVASLRPVPVPDTLRRALAALAAP